MSGDALAVVPPVEPPDVEARPRRRRGRSDLADRRLLLGADALFSVSEAAELLPGSPAAWRPWIRANVPLRRGPGDRHLVRWGDVLAATLPDAGSGASGASGPRPVRLPGIKPVKLGA